MLLDGQSDRLMTKLGTERIQVVALDFGFRIDLMSLNFSAFFEAPPI
jgi:hypothetical protein